MLLIDKEMVLSCSSAPELVVLLSDLNDAIEQLENKVNPLLNMVILSHKAKCVVSIYFLTHFINSILLKHKKLSQHETLVL